jgi:Protein of unknown function, DUF488
MSGDCHLHAKKGNSLLKTKRAYESMEPSDGTRILVDRLWPRGVKKEKLEMEAWLKDASERSGSQPGITEMVCA